MTVQLDKKDRKILYQLETNCRQPLSKIAKKVGLSREVINYRIKQLEKKKIIDYYITVVDYVKLGYTFCRVWFKYQILSKEIEKKIIDFARKSPHINWIAIGDGLYNVVLVYLAKNLNLIEDEFDKLLYEYGKYIVDVVPSVAFKIYHFKHTYLHNIDDRKPIIIGSSAAFEKINDSDQKILNKLVENPRISYIKLAQDLNISTKTISKRVAELMKRGVIKQFKAKINTNILGYEHQKVMLYLSNQTEEKMKAIIAFLSHEPRIIFITKPFATAGLEFEIIVKGRKELYEFLQELMLKFPEVIRNYNVCLIYNEPFSTYLSIHNSL